MMQGKDLYKLFVELEEKRFQKWCADVRVHIPKQCEDKKFIYCYCRSMEDIPYIIYGMTLVVPDYDKHDREIEMEEGLEAIDIILKLNKAERLREDVDALLVAARI